MSFFRYLTDKKRKPLLKKISGSRVLEVGAANKSYESWCSQKNVFTKIDIKKGDCEYGDITQLKYADESFDAILCFNVFEHVFDFQKAFNECYRVLKPGGVFLLSVPMCYPLHDEPNDYWRFTKHSLEKLLSGFSEVSYYPTGWKRFPFSYVVWCIK